MMNKETSKVLKYISAWVLLCSVFFAVQRTNAQYVDITVKVPDQLTLRSLSSLNKYGVSRDETSAEESIPGDVLEWFEIANNENSVVSVDIIYKPGKKRSAYYLNGPNFEPWNAKVITSDYYSFYLQNQSDKNAEKNTGKYRAWIGVPTNNIIELKLEYH